MKLMKPGNSTLVVALALLLAGCGGSQPPIGAPGARLQSSPVVSRAERRGSWMLPEAKGEDLLYVSNPSALFGTVLIFTYPQGKLVGSLGYIGSEFGECVDAAGHVFITTLTDDPPGGVYEYAHASTRLIRSLGDPGVPNGCAVDVTTGNLAVANRSDSVAIYARARGKPKLYYNSKFGFAFCGYDDQGNLYLSAQDPRHTNQFRLIQLVFSTGTFESIHLSTKLYGDNYSWPSVQWDGSHMTISSEPSAEYGKRGPILIYRLNIAGRNAKVVGTTELANRSNPGGQSWIQGKAIIGLDLYRARSGVPFWPYPKGGKPWHNIRLSAQLWGATVSVAHSH